MQRYFYVTMVRGASRAWLAGPFDMHAEAVQKLACDNDPFHCFDAFGTSSLTMKIKTAFGDLRS